MLLSLLLSASMATPTIDTTFRFAQVYKDHMVLQQNLPASIWGWAPPGSTVTITLQTEVAVFLNPIPI